MHLLHSAGQGSIEILLPDLRSGDGRLTLFVLSCLAFFCFGQTSACARGPVKLHLRTLALCTIPVHIHALHRR